MFGSGSMSMAWMMILPGLFWLAVLLGLGFLVYALIRREQRSSSATGNADDPVAILRVRYARGEISQEEFVRMSQALGHRGGNEG